MIELRCKNLVDGNVCDRFIPLEIKGTTITRYRCTDRKCKQWTNIKIVTPQSSQEELRFKFEEIT